MISELVFAFIGLTITTPAWIALLARSSAPKGCPPLKTRLCISIIGWTVSIESKI